MPTNAAGADVAWRRIYVSFLYIFGLFLSTSIIETYSPLSDIFSITILRYNRIRPQSRSSQTTVIWAWCHHSDAHEMNNSLFIFHSLFSNNRANPIVLFLFSKRLRQATFRSPLPLVHPQQCVTISRHTSISRQDSPSVYYWIGVSPSVYYCVGWPTMS